MQHTLAEHLPKSLGSDRIQKADNSRTASAARSLNNLSASKPAMRRLELRKKLNEVISLEAEQKYISSTNMIEPAFDTASLKYLAAERGRNFGKEPSNEFKKDTLLRILNRKNQSADVFRRSRLSPEISHLIEVATGH